MKYFNLSPRAVPAATSKGDTKTPMEQDTPHRVETAQAVRHKARVAESWE